MSCLLLESFDTYATGNYTGKWQSMAGTIGAWGRNGTNGLTHTTDSFMQFVVSNKQILIAGMAMKLDATKQWNLFEFRDSATVQIGLYTDSSNQIIVKRGSTTLSSTGYQIPTDTWVYIELKAKIANSPNGYWELRINGVTVDSQTGIDTQQSGNAYATDLLVHFSGIGASNHYLDDIYLFDDTGSFCNDFVGDVYVEALFPSGAGYITQWAGFPVDGDANWQKVDEVDPDSETSFVATSGVGYIDSYEFENLVSTSGSVYALQINLWGRKDDAGSRTVNVTTRPTTVTYSGADAVSLGNSYAYSLHHFDYNPETTGYWTIAEINGAEFGIKQEA